MNQLIKSNVIKYKFMQNTKIILKIILPPIICLLIIVLTEMGIEYYPLSFGLIIGFINWNNHKYGISIGIFLSLLASYTSFFIAFFTFPLLFEAFKLLFGEDTGSVTALAISSFIIAPLLVFFLYKYVFHYSKTKITNYIILVSVLILITVFYLSDSQYFNFIKVLKLDHYGIWQVIMALAIQTIIYQKEIWKKIN